MDCSSCWWELLLYGHVSGEEFAPDTFERRVYSYFELPVLRIQVTPVRRTVSRPQLEQTLVDSKYITINSPPRRWDFVISHRLGEKWREGDAQILSQYLDAWGGEQRVPLAALDERSPGDRQDLLAGDCQTGPTGSLLVYS